MLKPSPLTNTKIGPLRKILSKKDRRLLVPTDTVLIDEYKNKNIKTMLSDCYSAKDDCNKPYRYTIAIGSLLNALFTHGLKEFKFSTRTWATIIENDPNIKHKSYKWKELSSYIHGLIEDGLIECIEKPSKFGEGKPRAGRYVILDRDVLNCLNELKFDNCTLDSTLDSTQVSGIGNQDQDQVSGVGAGTAPHEEQQQQEIEKIQSLQEDQEYNPQSYWFSVFKPLAYKLQEKSKTSFEDFLDILQITLIQSAKSTIPLDQINFEHLLDRVLHTRFTDNAAYPWSFKDPKCQGIRRRAIEIFTEEYGTKFPEKIIDIEEALYGIVPNDMMSSEEVLKQLNEENV